MRIRGWFIALLAAAVAVGIVALLRGSRTPGKEAPTESAVSGGSSETTVESESPRPAASANLGGELPDVLVDPEVTIAKRSRTLTVYSQAEPVKTYRIALGSEPEGGKEREGDMRTPIGEFYVCTKNPDSRYHRALGLSYPSEVDAERGLADGSITKRQYNDIIKAIHQMRQPPWNTPLGGEIMIHGGGTDEDWTEGCVALSDEDAAELFDALPLGTPVRIEQ